MDRIEPVYVDPNIAAAPTDLPPSRPRSARLVAEVSWSWSPAHSRTDVYQLSSDRNRSRWILWVEWPYEEGMEVDHPIAFCPRDKLSPEEAALLLLRFAWQKEREVYDTPEGPPHQVDAEGLVSAEQIRSISQVVWPNGDRLDA